MSAHAWWRLRFVALLALGTIIACAAGGSHPYRARFAPPVVAAVPVGVHPILADLLAFHPAWITRLQSSHDPNGANMDNAVDGANHDGTWQTLFHAKGEGRITRLWMTADSDLDVPKDYLELWITIDGKTAFRGKPTDLFLGNAEWKAPLVLDQSMSSGGYLSWVPFPFQNEAKILLRGKAHYYQVSWRQGPGSSAGPSAREIAAFIAEEWWNAVPPADRVGHVVRGAHLTLATGSTLITTLRLTCAPDDLPKLRLRVGGQASFPASFFFGFSTYTAANEGAVDDVAPVWPAFRSALTRSDPESRTLLSRLPIPLAAGEPVTLETDSTTPVEVAFSTTSAPSPVAGVTLRTDFRDQRGPGTPTTFSVFDETGPVQLVSFVEEIAGGYLGERGFLEGDEMIRFDGMRYPLHLGTGTEDYYNGGFYFLGVHGNPLSGLTRFRVVHPEDSWSHATFEYVMYRHHVLDPLVGRSGMRFGWESGEDGRYESASFRTLALAYVFAAPREVGRVRFAMGSDRRPRDRVLGNPDRWVTSAVDAEKAQVPFAFPVRTRGRRPTRLEVPCPPGGAPAGVLLVRDYDASKAGQSAGVSLQGALTEWFFEPFRNGTRRFAQDVVWMNLVPEDCRDGNLRVEVRALRALDPWTESAYEAVFYR